MIKQLKHTIALAALIAALPMAANATEGWYGRVDAGYSIDGSVETGPTDFDLDDDWLADIGVGYGFQNGVRAEAELGYRTNEVDLTDEDAEALSLMANVFYDFNRGGRWQPYLGVGVGYAQVDSADDDDANFAYQGLAGIGYEMTDQLTLDVGYRYFSIPEIELAGVDDAEYEHQAVTVGLRYQFAGSEPPPPPPPPPVTTAPPPPPTTATCPTSEFVVYFEWDRSNLNQAALETIDAAVSRARACNVGGVVVVGHTDTSGSTAYNQGLSERRAGVVRDALVARGIAAGAVQTQARGETDLARATRDGVREPLNRRTAVTISFR
jgi:outer membrane protein OmpA-like peptidoglycan-associated protein